jgi:hypothetical protein
VLPVFDLKIGNYGLHVSGEAYLNTVYLQHSQNNSPSTYNPISTATNTDFTSATRNVNGENAQLLDAFVYGSKTFGANDGQSITVKFGRQTLLWGQTLFFTTNGIAAGQAPVDVIKAESQPNAQTQEVVLPVGQAVVTYQPNEIFTFQGYYQFEWQPYELQGVGAYFSSTDILDKGGQRVIAGPGLNLYRVKSLTPPINNGQFGISGQGQFGNYDVGLFALRYDSKTPEVYFGAPQPAGPGNVGSYYLVYPRDIQIYGSSLSTTIGSASVGGEVSGRRNMPLVSGQLATATYPGSANAGSLWAVGSTMAAQASVLYVTSPLPFDPGGVGIDAEYAMNHVLSVDRNKAVLAPNRTATAGEFEVTITPTYYNILPQTTMTIPIGFTYDLFGRSQIDSTENHGTGQVSVGVTMVYNTVWSAGIVFNDYIGAPSTSLNPLADRGYLSFNVQRTF